MENKKAQLHWTFQGRFATKSSTKIQKIHQKYKKQQGRRLRRRPTGGALRAPPMGFAVFVFLVDFLYFCGSFCGKSALKCPMQLCLFIFHRGYSLSQKATPCISFGIFVFLLRVQQASIKVSWVLERWVLNPINEFKLLKIMQKTPKKHLKSIQNSLKSVWCIKIN